MRLIREIMSYDDILKKVELAGFTYDPEQDIFYSIMNPWQRKFGYCWLYDESCPPISLIIDCEPIRFRYGGKKWLIELWKGQYGMTTGAEIGVYNTTGPDINIPGVFNGTFYKCAEDEDHLQLFYALRKNNRILFTREGKHWWLTGFMLGEFSEPEELTLEARITLKDAEMCRIFTEELARMGYRDDEVRVKNKTVWITFTRPYSEQPSTRTKLTVSISQSRNRFLCEKFRELTKEAPTLQEKLNILQSENPELFDIALKFGKPRAVYDKYELLKKYL
ncbi:MAG: DUF4474 domain-containing protein [Clostridiales bacterium]|nr:DUF4474 domain-containing protein [Clostridiales bacterium]